MEKERKKRKKKKKEKKWVDRSQSKKKASWVVSQFQHSKKISFLWMAGSKEANILQKL